MDELKPENIAAKVVEDAAKVAHDLVERATVTAKDVIDAATKIHDTQRVEMQALRQAFEKNTSTNLDNLKSINERFDKMESMVKPIYDAFDFKKKLTAENMNNIVRWIKIVGLIISLFTLAGIIWTAFKFGVSQVSTKIVP